MAEEGTPPASAELLAELGAMKMRALQRRAEELGVEDEKLEDAEEKSAVIALIVARLEEQAAEVEAKRIAALKHELAGMKMRALQRRAEELGVEDEKLEEAEEKSEVIALILAAMPAPSASGDADGKATEREAARLARLRDELGGLKLRALQRRAAELDVDDDALDAAEEKSAVIDLIMAKETGDGASTTDVMTADVCSPSDSYGAHSGPAHNTEAKAESMIDIFAQWKEQGLHVMFS